MSYLNLPGTSGSYASTPDSVGVSVTGDLDLRVKVTLADWTPSSVYVFASKWLSSANQASWLVAILTDGTLLFNWTGDGHTGDSNATATSTAATGITDGQTQWVRVTKAGGAINFYKSVDGATYTQIGSTVVKTTTGLFDSTTRIEVGTNDGGTGNALLGQVHELQVRSGINGTLVANPIFSAQSAGTTSFADAQGNTWTLAGSAAIVATAVTLAPNDAAIVFSPYNWQVGSATARTTNPGAYLRTLVYNTASVTLGIDTTLNAGGNYPEIAYRVDRGPVQFAAASGNVAISLTSRAQATLIEVWLDAAAGTIDRWTNPTSSLTLTGITLDAGGTATAPATRPNRVLWYGDSITEGANARGTSGYYPTNTATGCHPLLAAEMLDAEVGVVAYQGLGLTVTAQSGSNVPLLPSSYPYLWSGVARSFSSQPDLIVANYGTNDAASSDASVTTAMGSVLTGLLGATTTSKIAVLRPLNGSKASAIQAAVTAAASARVTYVDTTGIFTGATAQSLDGNHPTASWHGGQIAPKLAQLLAPIISKAVFPATTKVASGEAFGPNGNDYTGTLPASGDSDMATENFPSDGSLTTVTLSTTPTEVLGVVPVKRSSYDPGFLRVFIIANANNTGPTTISAYGYSTLGGDPEPLYVGSASIAPGEHRGIPLKGGYVKYSIRAAGVGTIQIQGTC